MVAALKIQHPASVTFTNPVALVPAPRGVTVAQRSLRDALQLLTHVADRKSTLPILSHVAIRSLNGKMTLCATDLNITLTMSVDAKGVLSTGIATPAKRLLDMIKVMPGSEITIDRTEQAITITAGRATSRIIGMPDRDFPKIPVAPDTVAFVAVDAESLVSMIDATLFSVCRDETRFHLNGAFIEGNGSTMRMVTTDGHRLTVATRSIPGVVSPGVIVPYKGLQEIKRVLDRGMCLIGFSRTHMFVRQHGAELAIKLTDAQFPPYGQVVPKDNAHVVTVDRKALADAFARARLLSSDVRGVRITSSWDDLVITSDDPDTGDLTERVAIAGPTKERPISTGCNAQYMIEALDRINDERVTIAFSGNAMDPFLLRPAGDVALGDSEFQAVVMPMRI